MQILKFHNSLSQIANYMYIDKCYVLYCTAMFVIRQHRLKSDAVLDMVLIEISNHICKHILRSQR